MVYVAYPFHYRHQLLKMWHSAQYTEIFVILVKSELITLGKSCGEVLPWHYYGGAELKR